jgi:tetratricopeptide (TPR) repeat protein
LIKAVAVSAALLASPLAHAQMFKDADLSALYQKQDIPERARDAALAKRAQERLAANAADTQALLALAMARINEPDAAKREATVDQLAACTTSHPTSADCHYGHAALLGSHALQVGILKAASSAGKIREGFVRAVELAPQWYPPRSGLVQFYLQAPGFAGGSVSKARETARAAAKPEQGRVLEAMVSFHDKDYDAAQKLLEPHRHGADIDVDDDAHGTWVGLGFALTNDGKAERARPVFERLARERPLEAMGAYGLGRVAAELGQHAEAVKQYEQGARLKGADRLPVDYRMGLSLIAAGQRDAARASLQRFVQSKGPWSAKNVDDAKKKLQELS